ncbi:hypothetical protein [Paenibacillus antarcticus]|uniref:Uncharacterized protein n=1 Tax=Paenibacillus antarcticus TaxID=253703 RepID=A0A168R1R7_9BACL|nr:hypothetical protein [Paenibacillus antarcticus]OAB48474.1 hypothetical protein PBAT_02245 [Paenibacillus antarcticus]
MEAEQLMANVRIKVTLRYRICRRLLLCLMKCDIIGVDKGIAIHKKLLDRSMSFKVGDIEWQAVQGKEG